MREAGSSGRYRVFDKYSVIDMFGPVYGENWHKAEIHDGLTYRWTGPGRTSSLRIPTMGASEIRLRWILAVAPTDDQLSDIHSPTRFGL